MKVGKTVFGMGLLVGGVLLAQSAGALTYQNEVNVQFTFEPSLAISLSSANLLIDGLVPGNYNNSNTITVGVTTNNVAGYTLTAKVGGTNQTAANSNLVNTVSNTAFTSLSTNNVTLANFADNEWGYTLASSVTGSSTYSGLLYGTDTTLNATTDVSGTAATGYTGTNSTNFTIGAKAAASQAAGDYTNVITFTAVTNVIEESLGECSSTESCMQTFTADMCEAQASDAPVTLTDARDGSTYTVRYIEGACWMTQNLRITGTVSSEYSNFSTYDSVNVCEGDLTEGNSYNHVRCHDSGNTTNGVWYNYAAATAKTIIGESVDSVPTEDICPTNWHLPSYDPTNAAAGSINSLASSSTAYPKFSPVTGGDYDGGTPYNTRQGYWWSTGAYNVYSRYFLVYVANEFSTSFNVRGAGAYIRCVRQ